MLHHHHKQDCSVAIFPNQVESLAAINELVARGIPATHFSLITRSNEQQLAELTSAPKDDKMVKNAGMGAAAGATFGLLAGATLSLVPGLGPVIFAGALASGFTGGIVGGIVGAMSGWGIEDNILKKYENAIHEGKGVVIVHGDPETLAEANI
jgi:hypothetical protein